MTYLALITLVTLADLRAIMLANMTLAGLPTSAWQANGLWQNLVNWISLLLRGAYSTLHIVSLNRFLATASGQGLQDLGLSQFGTKYRGKTFANGTITLLNSSGVPIDASAESITIGKIGSPEITYRNTGDIVSWLNGTQLVIPIKCYIEGTVGNVIAGSGPFYLELVTTLAGVTLVEHSAIVGQDEQPEDDYKAICRKAGGRLSWGGPEAMWAWYPVILNTDGTISEDGDGKTRVNVNRVYVGPESTTGIVTLVLASPTGPVDAGEYATVIAFLMQWFAVQVGILDDYNCTAVPIDIDATVELDRGTSPTGVKAALEQYVTDWFGTTDNQVGGGGEDAVTVDELKGLIFRGHPKVRKATITAINGGAPVDVPIAFNESGQAGAMNFTVTVQP